MLAHVHVWVYVNACLYLSCKSHAAPHLVACLHSVGLATAAAVYVPVRGSSYAGTQLMCDAVPQSRLHLCFALTVPLAMMKTQLFTPTAEVGQQASLETHVSLLSEPACAVHGQQQTHILCLAVWCGVWC